MSLGLAFQLLRALPELVRLLRAFNKHRDNYEEERKKNLNESIKTLRVAFDTNDTELLNDTFNHKLYASSEEKESKR